MWLYVVVFVAGNITSLLLLLGFFVRALQKATDKNERVINEAVQGTKIPLPPPSTPKTNNVVNIVEQANGGPVYHENEKQELKTEQIEQPFYFDSPSKVNISFFCSSAQFYLGGPQPDEKGEEGI